MRLALILLLLAAAPAAAQTPSDRLPWIVIDARGATVGLPQAEGWVPVLPSTTELPGRYWGINAGATLYPFRLGRITLGVGAELIRGSGTARTLGELPATTPPATTTGTVKPPPRPVIAVVHTSVLHLAPHVSLNFGRKQGWSYLSAGLGRSKASSVSEPFATRLQLEVPGVWEQAMNLGGGARWFMKPHIGAGFDVRFITLPSRAKAPVAPIPTSPNPTSPNLLPPVPGTRLWSISVGISIQ